MHEVTSAVFGNERTIRVWLPEDYDDPANADARYRVLYLNDGQNVFDSTTAVFNPREWRADETVDSLTARELIPPVIVVAIDNAGRSDRAREYLPYPDEYLDPPEPNPRGDLYAGFLRDEVFPLIDSIYRTRRDARVLGGSSYGALVMLFVAARAPDLASGLLIESPSLYVNDGAIFDDLERADLSLERVYIGIGTNELDEPDCGHSAGNDEAVEDARELGELLERKLGERGRIHLNVEPCAIHDEAAWAARFPEAVRFLFPR